MEIVIESILNETLKEILIKMSRASVTSGIILSGLHMFNESLWKGREPEKYLKTYVQNFSKFVEVYWLTFPRISTNTK